MGHFWASSVGLVCPLVFLRCHADGCWGNPVYLAQNSYRMESRCWESYSSSRLHGKWRYIWVGVDRVTASLLFLNATPKPPCGNAPLAPYRYPLPFCFGDWPVTFFSPKPQSNKRSWFGSPAPFRGHVQLCCVRWRCPLLLTSCPPAVRLDPDGLRSFHPSAPWIVCVLLCALVLVAVVRSSILLLVCTWSSSSKKPLLALPTSCAAQLNTRLVDSAGGGKLIVEE
jgi:hypothetical protein